MAPPPRSLCFCASFRSRFIVLLRPAREARFMPAVDAVVRRPCELLMTAIVASSWQEFFPPTIYTEQVRRPGFAVTSTLAVPWHAIASSNTTQRKEKPNEFAIGSLKQQISDHTRPRRRRHAGAGTARRGDMIFPTRLALGSFFTLPEASRPARASRSRTPRPPRRGP